MDDLLTRRNEKINKTFGESLNVDDIYNKKLEKVRRDVDVIDAEIKKIIKIDGGFNFLKSHASLMKGWRVGIFSARSSSAGAAIDQFFNEHKEIVFIGWLQKPVAPERIDALLKL